jgi:amino acid transporter
VPPFLQRPTTLLVAQSQTSTAAHHASASRFSSYASQLWKGDDVSAKALAISCLWVTTFINCLGVSTASKLQNAFTGLKVLHHPYYIIITSPH